MNTEAFLDTVLEDLRIWIPAVLLFILMLADSASTDLFLRMGGKEANPVFRHFNILGFIPAEDWYARVVFTGSYAILFGMSERALRKGVKITNKLLVQIVSLIGWWMLFGEAVTLLWNLTSLL